MTLIEDCTDVYIPTITLYVYIPNHTAQRKYLLAIISSQKFKNVQVL